MKKLFSILVVSALLLGTQACKKCGQCEVSGVKSGEICEKDKKDAYDAAKKACEDGGGKWVTK
ncbi:MAG: hypothetical protein RMJ53_07995 [Chitinophagales bacterium]|nr:hypothetical protein [Chitinophagales bacterium]